MKGLFCSSAPIVQTGHGGGMAAFYEREALRNCCDTVDTLIVRDEMERHYPNNPFMRDYLAASKVGTYDVMYTNGSPWGLTFKASRAHKLIADCPAHNLRESTQEFKNCGMVYGFKHQTDPFLWPLYSQDLQRADVIVTQSKQSIGYLRDLGINTRCEVVPGGCHLPQNIKPGPDRFTVGYLGAAGPDKGVSYLVNAWLKLGYKDAVLNLGGSSSRGAQDALARFAGQANFNCLGWLDDISDFYNGITVYVQPSVTEGFALEVLEAWAHERPVICSKGAGAWELIDEGVDGLVFDPRDIDGLASHIDYLMLNPQLVERMGKAGRKKAEAYTWERAQKGYEAVIRG
jgi:glycosyltransferase involved in cell wall biosynthesis